MPSWFDKAKKFVQDLARSFTENIPGFPDWEGELQDSIEEAYEIIMRHIESEQPYGEIEEPITFYNRFGQPVYQRKSQYPSDRTGHIPISEGWFYETEREGRSIHLRIGNESQHFWAAIGDPSDYKESWDVPGPVIFWWGPPQKWIPSPPAKIGPQFFAYVKREKPIYNPFHRRAMERARPEITGIIREGIGDYLIEVFQRQGFRQR